jgi:predicted permease
MWRWRRYERIWGTDAQSEIEQEFAFHVRTRMDELLAEGMDEASARMEAERGFGDVDRVKARCYELATERRQVMRRREKLHDVWQDMVYAYRQMASQPLLTLAILSTIAVGIGATTSIFSVVNSVLLQPLPYRDSDRAVILWETVRDVQRGSASPAHLRDWSEQSKTIEAAAGWVSRTFNLTGQGDAARIAGASVTGKFFDVLYMPPAAGRYFDESSPPNEVVISNELWQTQFGGDRSIVGRSIQLNGQPFTVIGVTPSGYRLTDLDEQLWTKLQLSPADQNNYSDHGLMVVARMKPGVTRDVAQADMERVTSGIKLRVPDQMRDRGVNVALYSNELIGPYRTQLLVLLGAVLTVLLPACGNVANLLLARATARSKELAIRSTLGGGRARLIRQLLTESVVLAVAGGVLGVALAAIGVRVLVAAAPQGVPRMAEAAIDGPVLLFATSATFLCGLLFGLAPALRASRTDLQSVLRAGGRSSRGSAARDQLRNVLVAGEIAVALVLVVAAGLFIRSAQASQRVPLGFEPSGLMLGRVSLPAERYGKAEVTIATYTRMLETLRSSGGVTNAAIATRVPLWGASMDIPITMRDFPRTPDQPQIAHVRLVSDGYFEALDVPLVRGRPLQSADMRTGAPPVVVINETLARQAFGKANPIGQFITAWNGDGAQVWREVIGVARDMRSFGREAETPAELFFPFTNAPASAWNAFQRTAIIMARGSNDKVTTDAMRAAVNSVDNSLPLYNTRSMNYVLDLASSSRRFNMLLLSILGFGGLVLAAIGTYGVVGFFVMQRTEEFGVRMALGATGRDVLRLVIGHSGKLTLLGVLGGSAIAWAVTKVLSSMLFEVGARDLRTFVMAAVILGVTGVAAALGPARRAVRAAPLRALNGG